jgi:hypothetical protein
MDPVRLLTVLLWGIPFAISFGILGGMFGAAARIGAYWSAAVPETTIERAATKGAVNGVGFLAALGLGGGWLVGFTVEDTPIYEWLSGLLFATVLLMIGIILFGGLVRIVAGVSTRMGSEVTGTFIAIFVIIVGLSIPIAGYLAVRWSNDDAIGTAMYLLSLVVSLVGVSAAFAVLTVGIWLVSLPFALLLRPVDHSRDELTTKDQ